MDTPIINLSQALAARTSRRGLLGRTGQFLTALVGGSALLALLAEPAAACSCANPCYHWSDCGCSPKLARHYDCPGCSMVFCSFIRCTNFACGLQTG
jgi:hypothetical protein